MKVLVTENLVSGYGRVQVLYDVSVSLDEGMVLGIVGPNGAGKTTLIRTILGLVKPWKGRIMYLGRDITGLKTSEVVRLGIGYCPERGGILRTLTVRENIELVLSVKPDAHEMLREVYKLFPILNERANQIAGTLSGGEQRMLSLAKALLLADKLILLDEPSAGLAPVLKEKLTEKLAYINRELGISLLIAEQDPALITKVAREACIMERGTIVRKGSIDELLRGEVLREHYLGL